jgi:predicted  nucleic acid-binding Zn-ribbon protein
MDIAPEQIAALKMQLREANARLLSIERERRKLKEAVEALEARLKDVGRQTR